MNFIWIIIALLICANFSLGTAIALGLGIVWGYAMAAEHMLPRRY